MKWVGQQIYDFISRFRNDVYLENISTGTIASGGNLGLDSNNKIVKADTEAGELAFNGSTANGVLTYGDASTIDVESSLTFNSNTLSLVNSGTMTTTLTSTTASSIDVFGTAYGRLSFTSYDTLGIGSGAVIEVLDAALTATGGPLGLKAGGADGTNIAGGNVEIIGGRGTGTGAGGSLRFWSAPAGSSGSSFNTSAVKFSVDSAGDATIAGGLTMGSTSFVNSSGVVQVATQGTIDHNSLANYEASEHIRWNNDVSASATIHTNNITDLHGAGVDGSANQLLTDDGDGTVTSESTATWDGETFSLTSSGNSKPQILLTSIVDSNKPATLTFVKDRATGNGVLNDFVGVIDFKAPSSSDTNLDSIHTIFVQQAGVIAGSEAGLVTHKVLADGAQTAWLTATGSTASTNIDVNIGNGSSSMCTIAGDVTIEGDQITMAGSSTQSSRIKFFEDTDNGTNNTVLAGAAAMGGDRTITLPDADGTVALQNNHLHVLTSNFYDDIGTAKHYIPISTQSTAETTSDGNTLADFLVPCSLKVKEVMVKLPSTTTGSGNLTVGIETSNIGDNPTSKSIVETETVAVTSSNDNDIVHFMFDDTTHATIGQNLSITIQSSADLSSFQNWYVTTILEFDLTTRHTGSSAVQTS